MKYYIKALIIALTFLWFVSSMGCATPPKKEEVSEKDILVQNLTEENETLRREINRLTKEIEILMKEKLQLQEELETPKKIK